MSAHERDWDAFVTLSPEGVAHMDLAVEGVTCAACMVEIERGLGAQEGVETARLNLTSHRLAVDWAPERTTAERIVETLSRLGYRAHPFDPAQVRERADATGRELLRALAVSGFAMMNVMPLSVSVWSGADGTTRDLLHWVSALIALPATAFAGVPFFRSAWGVLRRGHVNMDVPISLAVLLASFDEEQTKFNKTLTDVCLQLKHMPIKEELKFRVIYFCIECGSSATCSRCAHNNYAFFSSFL